MVVTNEIYTKYVTEDLNNHKGLYHPVKAHFYERIKARMISPLKLHPNPDDEFSMEKIGPNWNIIGDYEKTIRERKKREEDIFDDPLIAVKLDKGGYMLLNGHHRWMAAVSLKIDKVPVEVVNITTDEDIYNAVNKSTRNKCVTIDLDEVLLCDDSCGFPFNVVYKENLRENAALLVSEVQRVGYDVWVYTGSYRSEAYIKGLFSINKCKVDGVVNGITNGKGKSKKLAEIFRSKYKHIVHIDNSMITCVDTEKKDYECIDLSADGAGWASEVALRIKEIGI